jgi:hypothetical protein
MHSRADFIVMVGRFGPKAQTPRALTVLPCASSGAPACDFRTGCLTALPVAASA